MTDIEILIAAPWLLCALGVTVGGAWTWIARRRNALPRARVVKR